jgi:hypothetical protein
MVDATVTTAITSLINPMFDVDDVEVDVHVDVDHESSVQRPGRQSEKANNKDKPSVPL